MARINKTQFALLGILTQCEFSGYDIRKFIEGSIGYFWTESFGQIYPNLKSLQKSGLIKKKQEIDSKGPSKIIYTITPSGHAKLVSWLSQSTEPFAERNELLLKLFFGSQMTIDAIQRHLEESKKRNSDLLIAYSQIGRNLDIHRGKSKDWPFWKITLEYGIRKARMEKRWIQSANEILKKSSKIKKKEVRKK